MILCFHSTEGQTAAQRKGPAQGHPERERWNQGQSSGSSPGLASVSMSLGAVAQSGYFTAGRGQGHLYSPKTC